MRHAYLILAHSGCRQLMTLLKTLDCERNGIYIHIDRKSKDISADSLKPCVTIAHMEVYAEFKVYWGGYSIVETELFLFEKARQRHYDYYHLLSGSDLPLQSQDEIDHFFESRSGMEFVHFDTDERLKTDAEIGRRTALYHFLQNYRNNSQYKAVNFFFTTLERCLLALQLLFHVNRMSKHPEFSIRYGSQWCSVTDDFVNYLLQKRDLIEEVFRFTNCADELFIQTTLYHSRFREKLYDANFDNDVHANMRLIQMMSAARMPHPRTWTDEDMDTVLSSDCLFARKFDIERCPNIVRAVCGRSGVTI